MKRILMFAAFAAALLSCNKEPQTQMGGGNYLKQMSLSLEDSATRSTSTASEFAINEASIFVYQKAGNGSEVLYKTIQTSGSSANLQLLFSDGVVYTYRFEVYANMGELEVPPTDVRFSNESASSLQMFGELSDVNASSSSSVVVTMDRYVGRIAVNSVRLSWKEASNADQEFTLKRIYIANVADVYGGVPAFNIDGSFVSSAMDEFLVSEINEVISNEDAYDVSHYLYGYGSDASCLVLECEWAGQTMYYHVDCDLTANSSLNCSLTIHQTGSTDPLGSVTDDALTGTGTLQASSWSENDGVFAFGNPPVDIGLVEIYPNTPGILCIEGSGAETRGIVYYTEDDWNSSGMTIDDVVGIAICDGDHAVVLHPTAKTELAWSNSNVLVNGCFTNEDSAVNDFAGESNTRAILDAVKQGVIVDAPAAEYCNSIEFKHGKKGYLPSAGEVKLIFDNDKEIDELLRLIGGVSLDGYIDMWTSSQIDYESAWFWLNDMGILESCDKDYDSCDVRPVSTFEFFLIFN